MHSPVRRIEPMQSVRRNLVVSDQSRAAKSAWKSLPALIAGVLGTAPMFAWAAAAPASSGAVEFNEAFTAGQDQSVDVSRFEKGNPVLPGQYRVDIYVNEVRVDAENVNFKATPNSDVAQPCFDYAGLVRLGIDASKLDAKMDAVHNPCIQIQDISADAQVKMNVGALRLDISVPQASMSRQSRGYVNPALWDSGETALIMGYSFNAYSANQSYNTNNLGSGYALTPSGSPIAVAAGTYYTPGAAGMFVPSAAGTYMQDTTGKYVQVQPNSYSAVSRRTGSSDTHTYLGLNLGLNVGDWRLRSHETMQWDERTGRTNWHNVDTTATHDITPWKAQLTVGDGYTQGNIFDTTAFRGLTIYSDDRMLPDTQQGYAPVIHGVANTQARVEVRQNNNVLYVTTVAPGPFVIDDLYDTGYGGDLTVTVFEADGSTHSFAVPFAAAPMLLRPGRSRWAVTDGQVRGMTLSNGNPYFVEGTYQRGLTNWLTMYGGVQSTYRALYKAYLVGAAVNTQAGSIGFDITNSHTNFKGADDSLSGYSARVSYSKTLPTYGTSFAVAAYRYSNSNFLSMASAIQGQDMMLAKGSHNIDVGAPNRSKQALQLTLSQTFSERGGSLYLTGSRQSYWNNASSATTYQAGYMNHYRSLNFGITASRTYASSPVFGNSHYDNQFGVNFSLPLGAPSTSTPVLSVSAAHDDYSGNTDRASVGGSFGERGQFNYNGGIGYSDQNSSQTTVNGSLGWRAAYGNLGASYSHSDNYEQASVSASGGLVVHPGGITLAPTLSLDSPIAIIQAPDAKGAVVSSSGQSKIDSRGYAVATSLMPYRMNDVALDPRGTSMDVELETTKLQTAPRAGAVIPLKFATVSGRAVMIRATRPNGDELPFGADVVDEKGQVVGMVGQGGQLFVRGAEDGGKLTVRWGENDTQQCHVTYQLPARGKGKDTGLETIDAVCR